MIPRRVGRDVGTWVALGHELQLNRLTPEPSRHPAELSKVRETTGRPSSRVRNPYRHLEVVNCSFLFGVTGAAHVGSLASQTQAELGLRRGSKSCSRNPLGPES